MSDNTGFLLINKSPHITSFDCITRIKKIVQQKTKIGHTGTLDPFATGLLIIAIGRQATQKIKHIMTLDKEYVAKGKLGELRDTLDYTGSIVQTIQATGINEETLQQAIHSFDSSYKQVPPIYSALKYQGIPLYKLARSKQLSIENLQKIASLKTRIVTLHSIRLLDFSFPYFTVKSYVSHGTYIRSLMHAIAYKASNCATTYALTRTKIGPFSLDHAVNIKDIKELSNIQQHIIPVEKFIKKIL